MIFFPSHPKEREGGPSPSTRLGMQVKRARENSRESELEKEEESPERDGSSGRI